MKLLTTLTSLFTVLSAVVASPVSSGLNPRALGPHYDSCPYPNSTISVINFEYTEGQKIADHRGLSWNYLSGFKRYYGYVPDGWAPIPSNYTTAHMTWDGTSRQKPGFGSGTRTTLKSVHSFWFYLGFPGSSAPAGYPVAINIWGVGASGGSLLKTIYTDPYDDGVWEHVCLGNWQVSQIVFDIPDCYSIHKGCKYAVFELDDIWVTASPIKPPGKVKPPVVEYDNGKGIVTA